MPRRRKKAARPPPGASPGTLVVDPSLPPPIIRVMQYRPEDATERKLHGPDEVEGLVAAAGVTWIDVDGLGNSKVMTRLGQVLGLHRLSVSDIVHVNQRPKTEDYGGYLFVVLRMPCENAGLCETEQVSLCLGKNFVVTFQEQDRPGDMLEPVRKRIRESIGKIRSAGPDYLAYAIIDAVIDAYFPMLERLGERLDTLEDQVLDRPQPALLHEVHQVRRDLISIRRATWPMREALNALLRDRSPLISDDTRLYLRDCHDHAVQIIDLVETYRDIDASIMDVYLSSVSNRLSEVMKVLTLIATIFIPLTFVVGVYGMNFKYFPELDWKWGYPAVWAFMLAMTAAMLWMFRRKGWLGRQ